MPKGYEEMKKNLKKSGESDKEAKGRAARIWNSQHPDNPVTRKKKSKKK